jgi:hypothetical protein
MALLASLTFVYSALSVLLAVGRTVTRRLSLPTTEMMSDKTKERFFSVPLWLCGEAVPQPW